MKSILGFLFGVLIALGLVAVFVLFMDMLSAHPRMIRHDCTMASFHPDYPPEVKKACRERGEA